MIALSHVEWAAIVKHRDDWTCQECGATVGEVGTKHIHAHHITPKYRGGKNTVENGTTLCEGCHNKIHKPRKNARLTSVRLKQSEVESLTAIAAKTESIAATSVNAGKPSWRTLIKRIAHGELKVIEKPR